MVVPPSLSKILDPPLGTPPVYSPYPQQFVGGDDYATAGTSYNAQTPLHQ